ANVYSKKDVEQILGRVLRMPYATRRKEPDVQELNRAYAHVSRASWPNALKQLHDRLVVMGCEETEAAEFIEKQPELGLIGGEAGPLLSVGLPPTVIHVAEDLSAFVVRPEEEHSITIEKTDQGSRVILTGDVPQETIERLTSAVLSDDARQNFEIEAK